MRLVYLLVGNIIDKITPYLKDAEIRIESYSQNSKNGKAQDLVTFGTILRYNIYKLNIENYKIGVRINQEHEMVLLKQFQQVEQLLVFEFGMKKLMK